MKVIIDQLYSWDGNSVFDQMQIKEHPDGYRFSKNVTIDGVTKTFLIISRREDPVAVDKFFNESVSRVKADPAKLKAFKTKTGNTPVLLNIGY